MTLFTSSLFPNSGMGFGCMPLTGPFYGEGIDEEEGIQVLIKAFELGVRHFDTAQVSALLQYSS